MLILACPYCGVKAEETELAPGDEAHLKRFGPGSSDDDFEAYMFARKNPKGVHFERWRHAYGCGKWFLAARCTATLEVFGTYPAQVREPPPDIIADDQGPTARLGGFRMSTRLARGGRLIDRTGALEFTFNGKRLRGYAGDTLASALLANDQMLVGRSFKYHRPRGIVASGPEEPNALVNLGAGRAVGTEPAHHHHRTVRRAGGDQPEPLAEPRIRRGRAEQLRRALPARRVLLQDLHPSARRSGNMCSSRSSASRRASAARRRTATPTAMNRPMPSATCWWSAAASRGCRRR